MKYFYCLLILVIAVQTASGKEPQEKEIWYVSPEFDKLKPDTVAVLPMDNLSFEPETAAMLREEVYERLQQKGYRKIKTELVDQAMKELGIQTAGQLSGISPEKLGQKTKSDAIIAGQVDQSAAVHSGVYDAFTVVVSLRLIHCDTGKLLWKTEQWRSAHRQWQGDPINLLINFIHHEKADRRKQTAWLVQEMLKTLPDGKIHIDEDNLLEQAIEIQAEESP